MEQNLDKVFQIEEESDDQVIVKVINNDNPLTIAKYPFIDGNMAYITVTRGNDHVLTVVNKNGKTFSFHWGDGGYTLISEGLERLKRAVVQFIERENHILLERSGWDIKEAHIFYNNNYKKWQLTLEGGGRNSAHWWSSTATCFEDMADEAVPFLHGTCDWIPYRAATGIQCWKAVL